MQYRRWLLVVALGSWVGCGAQAAPGEHGLAGPMPVWTADANGRPYGVPHVDVTVNGHAVDVMLDTGASQHFLLSAAAWAYDVPSEPFDALATDAHGAHFPVRLAQPGRMHVPGRPFHAPPQLFLLDSPSLLANGVLGGVAPQLLAPVGYATVLDFPAGRLDVVRALRPARSSGRVCAAGPDSRDGWRYVVPVRIGGHDAALLVDTGAESTTVYDGSPFAEILLARPDTGSVRVAGAASIVEMRTIDRVPLELGGATLESRVTVGPGQAHCGEEGLLGFDALRRCRVAMSADDIVLECGSGEPALHRAPARSRAEPVALTRIEGEPACGLGVESVRPRIGGTLPFRFDSAIDAYVALFADARAHADRIASACGDDGYLEASVREPLIERQGRDIVVRFSVEEGRRFTVGAVTVSMSADDGAQQLDARELAWLRTRSGQPYRRADAVADARAIADVLTANGVPVREAGFGRALEDGTVNVHFALMLRGSLPPQSSLVPPVPAHSASLDTQLNSRPRPGLEGRPPRSCSGRSACRRSS